MFRGVLQAMLRQLEETLSLPDEKSAALVQSTLLSERLLRARLFLPGGALNLSAYRKRLDHIHIFSYNQNKMKESSCNVGSR